MKSLLTINKDKVKGFTSTQVKAAERHFNEGWWKGFGISTICVAAGIIVGLIIVNKMGGAN